MRALFMGKNKPPVKEALKHLIDNGVQVSAVVAPPVDQRLPGGVEGLADVAIRLGIPVVSDTRLYKAIEMGDFLIGDGQLVNDIDIVISFLFWKKIRKPLIELPRIGCINFHPAPLPEFRGVHGYNFAIYESFSEWGVSAHFVDESFDTGDIIKVNRFKILADRETAFSLEQKSLEALLDLFKEIFCALRELGTLPRISQGEGRYISKHEFEQLRRINDHEDTDSIDRKIRAFWYPPYPGASIEIKGKEYTLVSEEIMRQIGILYHLSNKVARRGGED